MIIGTEMEIAIVRHHAVYAHKLHHKFNLGEILEHVLFTFIFSKNISMMNTIAGEIRLGILNKYYTRFITNNANSK